MERKQHAAGRGGAQMQECPSIESRCGVGAAHAADASSRRLKLDVRRTPFVAESRPAEGCLLLLRGHGCREIALSAGTGLVFGFTVGFGVV